MPKPGIFFKNLDEQKHRSTSKLPAIQFYWRKRPEFTFEANCKLMAVSVIQMQSESLPIVLEQAVWVT